MMVIIIMYLICTLWAQSSHQQNNLRPSQLARRDVRGQGTCCFISTDKLISSGSTQLFLDKRRKSQGQVASLRPRVVQRHKGIFRCS